MDQYHLFVVDKASTLTPVTWRGLTSGSGNVSFLIYHFLANLPCYVVICGNFHMCLIYPNLHYINLRLWFLLTKGFQMKHTGLVQTRSFRIGVLFWTISSVVNPDHADFLKPLWDMKNRYHITKDWLSKLKVLSSEDLIRRNTEIPTAPWCFATIALTENVEQVTISRFKA